MTIYHLNSPSQLYQHLAQHYKMYQVVESKGEYLWQVSTESQLDDRQHHTKTHLPLTSPKGLFFSERENLFHFDGECFRETLPQPEPFALFGVNSCDLHAIAYQDRFFANDPYYQARRQQALLVGLDCLTPCRHGFCAAVDAGPGVSPDTTDLTLHREATNLWLLTINSERGDKAVRQMTMNRADKACHQRRQSRLDDCRQQFSDTSHIGAGIAALNHNQVSASQWQALAQRCLTCSGCTSLCPTCSCFAIRDQNDSPTGDTNQLTRQRFWDSCLYDGFQREASQHNPSATAGERVRRFWYHKFSDDFVGEFHRYGCVGCGRCEQTCPGVIGVHSVMRAIGTGEEAQKQSEEASTHA